MRLVVALRSALVGLGIGGAALAWAQGTPLQTQETNTPGVVAELTECKRSEGVLTVKVRLRNTTGPGASINLIQPAGADYDDYFAVAAGKKYFVLRDSEKEALAVSPNSANGIVSASLPKGGTFLWWAKYPAPPSDVKKLTYVTPLGAPFEDVPVSDQ
jgi:hypothetical protein